MANTKIEDAPVERRVNIAKRQEQMRRASAKYKVKNKVATRAYTNTYILSKYDKDPIFKARLLENNKRWYYEHNTVKFIRYLYI